MLHRLNLLKSVTLEAKQYAEGTRSRGGKVLAPKAGFLTGIIEAVSAGELDDAYVVPISICYDRVVEHTAYIKEMVGAEKVPEGLLSFLSSVTSLIRDTASNKLVANCPPFMLLTAVQCFGRIDIGIAEPLSIRQFLLDQHISKDVLGFNRKQQLSSIARSLGYRTMWEANSVTIPLLALN